MCRIARRLHLDKSYLSIAPQGEIGPARSQIVTRGREPLGDGMQAVHPQMFEQLKDVLGLDRRIEGRRLPSRRRQDWPVGLDLFARGPLDRRQ